MESVIQAIPPWVHELPLAAKVAAVVVGLPVLAIVLNVLQQLVRGSQMGSLC